MRPTKLAHAIAFALVLVCKPADAAPTPHSDMMNAVLDRLDSSDDARRLRHRHRPVETVASMSVRLPLGDDLLARSVQTAIVDSERPPVHHHHAHGKESLVRHGLEGLGKVAGYVYRGAARNPAAAPVIGASALVLEVGGHVLDPFGITEPLHAATLAGEVIAADNVLGAWEKYKPTVSGLSRRDRLRAIQRITVYNVRASKDDKLAATPQSPLLAPDEHAMTALDRKFTARLARDHRLPQEVETLPRGFRALTLPMAHATPTERESDTLDSSFADYIKSTLSVEVNPPDGQEMAVARRMERVRRVSTLFQFLGSQLEAHVEEHLRKRRAAKQGADVPEESQISYLRWLRLQRQIGTVQKELRRYANSLAILAAHPDLASVPDLDAIQNDAARLGETALGTMRIAANAYSTSTDPREVNHALSGALKQLAAQRSAFANPKRSTPTVASSGREAFAAFAGAGSRAPTRTPWLRSTTPLVPPHDHHHHRGPSIFGRIAGWRGGPGRSTH